MKKSGKKLKIKKQGDPKEVPSTKQIEKIIKIKQTPIKIYCKNDLLFDSLFRLATNEETLILKAIQTEQARHNLIGSIRAINAILGANNKNTI